MTEPIDRCTVHGRYLTVAEFDRRRCSWCADPATYEAAQHERESKRRGGSWTKELS